MTIAEQIVKFRVGSPVTEADLVGAVPLASEVGPHRNQGNYEMYHAAGAVVRPSVIIEIGVRSGYSLRSMVIGAGGSVVAVCGFDSEFDIPGSQQMMALRSLEGLGLGKFVQLPVVDTQTVDRLPLPPGYMAQLIHVDGLHTEAGVYHDLVLVLPHLDDGGVILVDDCAGCIRTGTVRFCAENGMDLDPIIGSYTDLCVVTRRPK